MSLRVARHERIEKFFSINYCFKKTYSLRLLTIICLKHFDDYHLSVARPTNFFLKQIEVYTLCVTNAFFKRPRLSASGNEDELAKFSRYSISYSAPILCVGQFCIAFSFVCYHAQDILLILRLPTLNIQNYQHLTIVLILFLGTVSVLSLKHHIEEFHNNPILEFFLLVSLNLLIPAINIRLSIQFLVDKCHKVAVIF